jgi:hypothetical protein
MMFSTTARFVSHLTMRRCAIESSASRSLVLSKSIAAGVGTAEVACWIEPSSASR